MKHWWSWSISCRNFLYSWNGLKWLEPRLKCALLWRSAQVARMPAYCFVLNTDSFTQCAGRQSTHRVKVVDFVSCLCTEQVLGGESIKLTHLQYTRCSFLYTVNNKKMAFPLCNNLTSHWLYILLSACKDPVHICFTVHALWGSGFCEQGMVVPYRQVLYWIYLMSIMFKQSCTWHCNLIYCVLLFLLLGSWLLVPAGLVFLYCLMVLNFNSCACSLTSTLLSGLAGMVVVVDWPLSQLFKHLVSLGKSWGKFSEVPRLL